MRILITGTAGFVGFHLARRLIADGHEIYGVDGMTPYYDVRLKRARHEILRKHNGFSEHIVMLEDQEAFERVVAQAKPDVIVHLAAQAGVRYSLENPRAYVDSNLIGTFNVMEAARRYGPQHFLLASTSSVYGGNTDMPFSEIDRADHPLTFYAATKKATELMSHSYSHLWKIPTTVFRFFTVYGPWGRPDMALFKFVDATLKGNSIDVYNHGQMSRDFTFVDDLVESIVRLIDRAPSIDDVGRFAGDSLSPVAPWRTVNIGGGAPTQLLEFIGEMEKALGRPAVRNNLPMQAGDVPDTYADAALLQELIGYKPSTPVSVGVRAFCAWYESYHATLPEQND